MEIEEIEAHPDSDKLFVTFTDENNIEVLRIAITRKDCEYLGDVKDSCK